MQGSKKAKDFIEKEVITTDINSSIQDISKLLIENKLSGMAVIDEKGELAGFISERDIIKAISLGDYESKKAKDIMIKDVIALDEETSAEEASQIFSKYPFRYIPVCKNKKVIGIISRKNVIEKLLGQYY